MFSTELTAEVREIETRAVSIVERANAVRVTDGRSYILAGETWKHLREMEKVFLGPLDLMVKVAHNEHKKAVSLRSRIIGPLEDAQRYIKGQMEAWDREQERLRLEEERRLAEEARRAEEARKAAELEEARRLRVEEEARLLAEAQQAEDEGNTVLAEAILEAGATQVEALNAEAVAIAREPVVTPVVVVDRTVPKVSGGPIYRTVWDVQVVDLMALVRAVAAGTVPLHALKANEVFLRQQATSLKDAFRIPGCRAYSRRV